MEYNKEPQLFVVRHWAEYLKRRQTFRKTNNLLSLYIIKPHRTTTKVAASRFCKSLLKDIGKNIDNYNSHLSKFAASSYAKSHGVTEYTVLVHIEHLKKTFGKFSGKKIEKEVPNIFT